MPAEVIQLEMMLTLVKTTELALKSETIKFSYRWFTMTKCCIQMALMLQGPTPQACYRRPYTSNMLQKKLASKLQRQLGKVMQEFLEIQNILLAFVHSFQAYERKQRSSLSVVLAKVKLLT